jgi:phage gp29-like protein
MAVQLVDYLGNPITLPARPSTGRAGAVQVNDRLSSFMPVTTPSQLRSAFAAADRGDLRGLMAICEQVENDPDVGGAIRQRRLTVSQLPWRVNSADPGNKAADDMATDCDDLLKRLDLRTAIEHHQSDVLCPFAVSEIEWLNRGNTTTIASLTPRMASEFSFDFSESGEQLRLRTDSLSASGEVIDPLKYVVSLSREKGRTLITRGGLVRGVAGIWVIKWHCYRNWAIFAEIFGIPWRIGRYDPGASDEMILSLRSAVRGMGVDAAAVISRDMDIEIKESVKNSGQSVFGPFISILNNEIAKGINGQTATSNASPTGLNSGMADVQNEVRLELQKADAANKAALFNRQVIRPYVIFNYGEQTRYPELEIQADPKEDLAKRLEIDEKLARMGVPLPIKYFYSTYDRPEPQADDEVLQVPQSAADPFGFPPASPSPSFPAKKKVCSC